GPERPVAVGRERPAGAPRSGRGGAERVPGAGGAAGARVAASEEVDVVDAAPAVGGGRGDRAWVGGGRVHVRAARRRGDRDRRRVVVDADADHERRGGLVPRPIGRSGAQVVQAVGEGRRVPGGRRGRPVVRARRRGLGGGRRHGGTVAVVHAGAARDGRRDGRA